MVGTSVSFYRILEQIPTTLPDIGSSSGHVAGGRSRP